MEHGVGRQVVALATVSAFAREKDYPVQAVPPTAVKLQDAFWAPRLETNRTVTIPHVLKQLEAVGSIEEFETLGRPQAQQAARLMWGDSNIYKTIQGMVYSLHAPIPTLPCRNA